VSKYGTLIRIQKSDIVSGFQIFDRTKVFSVNYLGLTIARYDFE